MSGNPARLAWGLAAGVSLAAVTACPSPPPETPAWRVVHEDLDGALLSVWGTGTTDVWAVGADSRDGKGPLVIHYDGQEWSRLDTGLVEGDFWWVFGFEGGPIYMGGAGGVIVRYLDGAFTVMETPSDQTVFGIWGASKQDVWAVGGASDATGGFAWRLEGEVWIPEASLPADVEATAAVWKVFGTAADDAWLVGSNGVALHWDGSALSPGDTGVGSSLFTVHARDGLYAAVGGFATGIIVEFDAGEWRNVTPDPPPAGLSGVALGGDGSGIAVGLFGGVYVRDGTTWQAEELGFGLNQNLHATWIDEEGGFWAVGGQTLSPPFTEGVLIHKGYDGVSTGGL